MRSEIPRRRFEMQVEDGFGDESEDQLGLLSASAPLEFAACETEDDCCSRCCCCCCDSIGNMHVICEHPPRPGEPRQLQCVAGPYWYIVVFVTTPCVAVPCGIALVYMAPLVHPVVTLVFALATLLVLGALLTTACTDPGLVVRVLHNPEANRAR